MKKIYTLAFFVLFAFAAQAQVYFVTLAVDMSNETAADTISVAGDFQASDLILTGIGDWSAGAHKLTDTDGNGVWQITVQVPAGTYVYKFLNGTAWGTDEGSGLDATCGVDDGFGNFNREMTISSDTTIAYFFNSCAETTTALNTNNLNSVTTFKVSPNPISTSAWVEIDNAKSNTHDVIITNIAGQTVRTMNAVAGDRIFIERGNLRTGVYFLTIINEEGQRGTQKLVIR